MNVWVLGSGSRGNAVLVESGACRVLVDVGFGPRVLAARLQAIDIAPESIEACIITHEHSDHSRGATRAARRWHWPVFATYGTAAGAKLSAPDVRLSTFKAADTLSFSDLEIATHATPHDANEPIGVTATARSTGLRAAVCTDLGYASEEVRQSMHDVDVLVLESNHDEEMLRNGRYPAWLRARIASDTGHLSNRACSQLVRESVSARLRAIVLAHLSEENNTPSLACGQMRRAVKGTGFSGLIVPALQDSVVGPISADGMRHRDPAQLSLGI